MKRRIFTCLSAVSAVLFVVVVVGSWVGSYWWLAGIGYLPRESGFSVELQPGQFWFATIRGDVQYSVSGAGFLASAKLRDYAPSTKPRPPHRDYLRSLQYKKYYSRGTFIPNNGFGNPLIYVSILPLSHWLLALLTAILPTVWFWRWRRQRRRLLLSGKVCLKCGYDLRESKDQCPECGAEIPTEISQILGPGRDAYAGLEILAYPA